MELKDIRGEIDRIDSQLVKLFAERMDCARAVAESKKQTGKPIRDHARERDIVNRLTGIAGDEYAPYVRDLYRHIFDMSRGYQAALNCRTDALSDEIARAVASTKGSRLPARAVVACQGVEGAYSQQACEKLFDYPDIRYFETFDAVFAAVEKGDCEYGVLPIENSTAGSVVQVYDLMETYRCHICGAQKLRIDHRLMRKAGSTAPIREVVSHEQALRQCSNFFAAHPEILPVPMRNTAVAAEYVAHSDRDDVAVIASQACADLYGLEVASDGVANQAENHTRFICISRELQIFPTARKISLMLDLAHEPGALNAVVSRLAIAGVNLTKLESRPIPGSNFNFRFFFDLSGSVCDPDVVRVLCEVRSHCESFSFLGCYDEQ